MKSAQQGKGFAQVLILVGAAILVIAVLLLPQLTKNNTTNTPDPSTKTEQQASAPAASGDVALMLDPAAVSATATQTFTVDVKVDTKSETISAAEVHLKFDPEFVTATAVKNGTFLPVVLTPGKMDAGTASIVVGSNPTTPQKGTGTLATVTFTAKKMGTTKISFDTTSAIAAIGKTASVLGPTTEATVTIK